MTMRHYADLFATVGEYRDAGGQKCKRQIKAGAIFRDDHSSSLAIKIDVLPVSPTWSGWLSVRNAGADSQEMSEGASN